MSSVCKIHFDNKLPDANPWIYAYEEEFYCPTLIQTLKIRRREARNNIEVVKFRQTIISRWKRIALLLWRGHILRRHKCRVFFLWYDARKRYDVIERCFDKWRAFAIMDRCSSEIQRVARGFIGRRRRDLTKAVVQRSVIIQAVSRKAYHRKKYSQLRERRHWGAITIQVFRKLIAANM